MCFCLGWLSEVCVSAVCVSAVLCLVCLPLRVRPRVCPVPVLRFLGPWGTCKFERVLWLLTEGGCRGSAVLV